MLSIMLPPRVCERPQTRSVLAAGARKPEIARVPDKISPIPGAVGSSGRAGRSHVG